MVFADYNNNQRKGVALPALDRCAVCAAGSRKLADPVGGRLSPPCFPDGLKLLLGALATDGAAGDLRDAW